MGDSFDLDRMLEEWDEKLATDPSTDLESFIQERFQGAPEHIIEEFRREVRAISAFDQQLRAISGASEGSSDTSANSYPKAETDAKLTLADLKPGTQPITGYTLVARLGSGGFGEVWKATAPGGFHVALKFVRLEGRQGQIEQRALSVIKEIRHPNLLSVFGAWEADQFLVIATELANRTLWERFEEAVKEGHRGIPRDELLEYFAEAAKGIDHLNAPQQAGRLGIQHRDIKPQNLLLSGGGVKVADFGLARALHHDVTGHTGSLTLSYAAPECLDGSTSSRSDQYSLAVSYCQLRGGKLPFEGSQVAVIDGHRKSPPDLSMLPVGEHEAVARALAKSPQDRWDSCADFVNALKKGNCAAPSVVKTKQRAEPPMVSPLRQSLPPTRPFKSGKWLITICAATAVLVLGVIGIGRLTLLSARHADDDGQPPVQALVEPGSPTYIITSGEWTWSEPVNLGSTVNSEGHDSAPVLSQDGLTLLFTSERPGGLGALDIWMSRRRSTQSRWERPVNLGTPINSAYDDRPGPISSDSRSLFFSSNRPGGVGESDIWVAERAGTNELWNEPLNIGSPVNSDKGEYVGSLTPDGLTLFFPSSRPKGLGGADIWMSSRPSPTEPWGEPTNLGTTVNTDSHESDGWITADGLTLLFGSRLSSYPYHQVLWMATRSDVDRPFSKRVVLGTNLTSQKTKGGAALSADGHELYFHSNRDGSCGSWDLWTAQRIRRP